MSAKAAALVVLLGASAAAPCTNEVRGQAFRARERDPSCAPCDRILWLCDEAPRTWRTVHEVREALRELRMLEARSRESEIKAGSPDEPNKPAAP